MVQIVGQDDLSHLTKSHFLKKTHKMKTLNLQILQKKMVVLLTNDYTGHLRTADYSWK